MKRYGKEILNAIFGDSWPEPDHVRYELRETGVWIRPRGSAEGEIIVPTRPNPRSQDADLFYARFLAHSSGNWTSEPALPIPFDESEFAAFLEADPLARWDFLEAPFTNDDGTLDRGALGELGAMSTDAELLVRATLNPSGMNKPEAPIVWGNAVGVRSLGGTSGKKPRSRVRWRVYLEENLPKIDQDCGGRASVDEVIRWLRRHGGGIVEPGGRSDEIQWKDLDGEIRRVARGTVSNYLSELKRPAS